MSAMTNPVMSSPAVRPATGGAKSQQRHLRLVEQLRQRPAVSRRKLTMFLAVLCAVVIAQLALATLMMQDAYRADALKAERLELQRERTAALEIADAAASPQQLAQRATEIGMVPSTGYAYLDVERKTVQHDPDRAAEFAKPINPSLVENKAAQSDKKDDSDATKRDDNGASQPEPVEPAVPSEFELRTPQTH